MIGIVGQGFVGNAVYQKFKSFFEVLTFDLIESKCNSNFNDLLKCEFIFICLPTPTNPDGSCDFSLVENTIIKLNSSASIKAFILKSTVPPGTTNQLNIKYGNKIVFNPEFLTERNAVDDFEKQKRIILGGPRPLTTKIKYLFSKTFPNAHIVKTDSTYAEMIKYLTNSFLATKVSFANEIYQLCDKYNIDYDKVIEYAIIDERLGKSHWSVPGPDGDFGFGGHCFPKDLNALIYLTEKYSTTNNILKSVIKTNDAIRTNRDWEQMFGRAVNKKKNL